MEHSYVIIDSNPDTVYAIQLAMENFNNFICIGISPSEQEGLDIILERNPSLVFLNIELEHSNSGITGYYMLDALQKYVDILPQFIALSTTAKYAIEGIRYSILDYIMTPIDKNVLRRTLFRFRKLTFNKPEDINDTLCLKSYGDYKFVNTNEVLFLKADNNTTDFVRVNGSTVSAFKTLKFFQDSLPEHFIRIHNSYIVNSHYISRIHFGKSQCTMEHSDVAVPFSKSYRENVEMIRDNFYKRSLVIA
ncbi:LytTR family transcriptional regulator DNA-binding domain-containing protein [uncultured Dokdonia sp.]|uniref:LytR/AlgR family response regulator transcription factor n=1 Tax=uncultured Dokdonia sp. TaxID=575653 RepID=UPI00263198F2|nr:LytTR family transcriptional regulator DNA-binding domain-containing protein [uncultured Dokdonia sp.]